MSMLRTIKPKNARVKRALDEREPKDVENEKTAIFVRGNQTSEKVKVVMKDLYALKQPSAINFSKKNHIHPFEDASSLEFFSQKNDASLFLTGLHSKKRPHDLVFTRMFDGRVLDQIELGIEEVKGMAEFKTAKSTPGHKAMMVFHSDLFDTHPHYIQLKSLLLDFYNGHALDEIPLAGLEHVISVTAGPMPAGSANPDIPVALPLVHLRVYTLRLLASGSRIPRVELTEMGPSIDLSLRRLQTPDPELLKHAMKRAKIAKSDIEKGLGKKRKNVETDEMGDLVGRIHLGKQDLSKLQARKMKGLKGDREERKRVRTEEKAKGGSHGAPVAMDITED